MLSGHIGHPKKAAILTDKGRQAMDTRANLPEGPGLPYRREESPSQGIYQAFRRERTIRQKCGHSFRHTFSSGTGNAAHWGPGPRAIQAYAFPRCGRSRQAVAMISG